MKRTGRVRLAWTLVTLALAAALLVAPAPAEAQLYRILGMGETDGEPTDPDGALAVLNEVGLVPEDNGLTATPPDTEVEAEAWWSAILDLLEQLLEGDTDR
jgi:hypothetical protein